MQKQYRAHNSLLPFYLSWLTQPDNSNYNLCFSYQLDTRDEAWLLVEKLQNLIQLRPYLRQTFDLQRETLLATIHSSLPAKIRFINTSKDHFLDLENKLLKYEHDISRESGIHVSIIYFDNDEGCVVFFNIHHMLVDGTSLDTFVIELNELLNGKNLKKQSSIIYRNQVLEESSVEELPDQVDVENYLYQLRETSKDINLFANASKTGFHYVEILSREMFESLDTFCKRNSISIFNLLLLVQSIFFCKLFDRNNFLSHYPVDIRDEKKIDGCFINFVPFLLELDVEKSFLSLIESHKKTIIFLKKISKSNFSSLSLKSIASFAYSNHAKPIALTFFDKKYASKSYSQLADSAFGIKYRQINDELIFSFDIKGGILQEYLADSLLSRFLCYLNKLIRNPQLQLIKTDLTFDEEKQKILYCFNDTRVLYPKDKTIHQLFTEQAKKTPENIAIVYGDEYLTYAQLDDMSTQLAYYFINRLNVCPKNLIALCLESSSNLIISMIAVLKAGCAYVTLDPASLRERAAYILKDSTAKILLTNAQYLEKINELLDITSMQLQVIAIDDHDLSAKISEDSSSLLADTYCHNMAHIIYTSGTTGFPKGVMVTHRNVLSLTQHVNYINISEFDTFALFSDTNFDASTFEIWSPLLNGARLFIPVNKKDILSDPGCFKKTLKHHHISILWLTKTLFDQLYELDEGIFSRLNYLLIGGEALSKFLIYKLAKSQYKPLHLINGYGPTENTTFSCSYVINDHQIQNLETVPIGTPLSNRVAYILDKHLNLLPIGAVGELFVGGDGLTLGYWNQERLTKEKFILNPFPTESAEHTYLYRTGDLVRMLPDGNIEYLCRNDFQVKIRGYRVELSEIENRLMEHPEIKQTVVMENRFFDSNSKDQYLIAYYVSKKELSLTHYLVDFLPDYMLPKLYIHLSELPKTNSGKLDRTLLPNPDLFLSQANEYIPPSNEVEKLICAAFSQVLGVEKVGIHDDFFLHGGNSIKAIALTSMLQSNYKITISDVFNKKTPEKISQDLIPSHNDLNSQLDKVKQVFQKKNVEKKQKASDLKMEMVQYVEGFKNTRLNSVNKNIKNILLSGATGYLGCNILFQLLKETDYKIYLLVRASSDERALVRIIRKFYFYFKEQLQSGYNERVIVLASDIEKPQLGLVTDKYDMLVKQVDSIVHAAALTRHYGEFEKFYSANVVATINLLELARLTKTKDFHHISTISVLHNSADNKHFYIEDDFVKQLDSQSNFYIKTKHEAECQVLKYKNQGVNVNIYRIGNLAFILKNFRTQENIEDNAFYNRIKCLITLKAMAKEIATEEISPVDYTARAIVKILEKKELANHTYHVLNPNICNIANFFSEFEQISMHIMSIDKFLELLKERMSLPNIHNNLIIRFLLHQGWLDGEHKNQLNSLVMQDKTDYILNQLGFEWPKITKEIFFEFIEKNYFY